MLKMCKKLGYDVKIVCRLEAEVTSVDDGTCDKDLSAMTSETTQESKNSKGTAKASMVVATLFLD